MNNRVGMNIAAKMEKISFILDQNRLVVPFKERAAVVVTEVVSFSIAVENVLREQARFLFPVLPDAKMVVVGQERIGDECQRKLLAILLELSQDEIVIRRLVKNRSAMRAAVVKVIVVAGDKRRTLGRHGDILLDVFPGGVDVERVVRGRGLPHVHPT